MFAKVRIAGGVIALTAMVVFAQETGKGETPIPGMPLTDNTVKAINAVNINPAGLIWGNINASYERFLKEKYGAMLQAEYFFKQGFGVAGHFRYHYFKNDSHSGISSPFIGGFVCFESAKDEANVENASNGSTTVYPVDVTYLKIGLNWGRRWVLSNSLTIVGRIGYGFPVMANFKWPDPDHKPSDFEKIQNKKKYWNGVDAEASIGYAF
jgi:hypothetical protein